MRMSKAESEKNKQEILEAAGRLFRKRGFDGVGVAELMKAAGFTHGGFYNHFSGKDELEREAVKSALTRANGIKDEIAAGKWKEYVREYLTREHRDGPDTGCTLAALAPDAARKDAKLQGCFAHAIEEVVSALAEHIHKESALKKSRARGQAMQMLSELVGALVLSRAVASGDPELSAELLTASRQKLAV
jgi:TetR/AcrR family transcriptional repressor of nem operon